MIYKLVFVLVVSSALLAEGLPSLAQDLVEAARSGNWKRFHSLVSQQEAIADWANNLSSNVENLKPNDRSQVRGHSISIIKEWSDDGTKHSEHGEGKEIINNNGQVTVRRFQV